jgi:son of sevenless-like protein
MNNFNGLFEMTSGLLSAAARRLYLAWGQLDKPILRLWEKISAFVAGDGNFAAYRDHLQTISQSCIPYIGLYLSDLTFIEEGNPIFLKDGMVNFAKCKMVADVIKKVQRYQQKPYNLTKVDVVSFDVVMPDCIC